MSSTRESAVELNDVFENNYERRNYYPIQNDVYYQPQPRQYETSRMMDQQQRSFVFQFKEVMECINLMRDNGIIEKKQDYIEVREERKHLTPGKFMLILFGICLFAVVVL